MGYYTFTSDGLQIRDFDIRHTFDSAQPLTFHADYDHKNGSLEYTSSNNLIKGKFKGNIRKCGVKIDSDDVGYAKTELVNRFRLNDDMEDIYTHIATDEFLKNAVKKYRGMRVTLNDPWETTLCFILSQYNNVKRIRLITKRMVQEFGHDITNSKGKVVAKSFPTSSDLLDVKEEELRKCGTGFRAKYITKAAEYCTENLNLYKLQGKPYFEIKEQLMEISGVGDKVADCIALMGYGKFEAFPIDVWVKRTLEKVYFKAKERKIADLHKFAEEKWGNYRGYAQQYLFHFARDNNF